jgi:hypothetical protein
VGTRGQLTTQSGTTVEGGSGLVLDNFLDNVLDVPRDNVHLRVDGQRVLSVLHHHVSLHEPALGDHVGELVLDGVHAGVDFWRVLSVLLRRVSLLEPVLHVEHLVELVLDGVHAGVDCWRVLSVLLRRVSLLKPALHVEHHVKLVLGPKLLASLDLTSKSA